MAKRREPLKIPKGTVPKKLQHLLPHDAFMVRVIEANHMAKPMQVYEVTQKKYGRSPHTLRHDVQELRDVHGLIPRFFAKPFVTALKLAISEGQLTRGRKVRGVATKRALAKMVKRSPQTVSVAFSQLERSSFFERMVSEGKLTKGEVADIRARFSPVANPRTAAEVAVEHEARIGEDIKKMEAAIKANPRITQKALMDLIDGGETALNLRLERMNQTVKGSLMWQNRNYSLAETEAQNGIIRQGVSGGLRDDEIVAALKKAGLEMSVKDVRTRQGSLRRRFAEDFANRRGGNTDTPRAEIQRQDRGLLRGLLGGLGASESAEQIGMEASKARSRRYIIKQRFLNAKTDKQRQKLAATHKISVDEVDEYAQRFREN